MLNLWSPVCGTMIKWQKLTVKKSTEVTEHIYMISVYHVCIIYININIYVP